MSKRSSLNSDWMRKSVYSQEEIFGPLKAYLASKSLRYAFLTDLMVFEVSDSGMARQLLAYHAVPHLQPRGIRTSSKKQGG